MPWGEILRIETDKGFGFIKDDSGMDWFFVAEDVRGGRFEHIWVGERVGFTADD
jgi:cold shock CspA family protein